MLDKHYLTPLFAPRSVVVLAGSAEEPDALAVHAPALHAALRAQAFTGTLQYVDFHRQGTLAELAQTQADLAVIALAPEHLVAALELAGRMHCKAALVLSSGVDAALAHQLQQTAQREGVHLLGPNTLGLQRPALGLNAAAMGPLAQAGSLGLVCQSGALTASILDWARNNGVGFSSVVSLGAHTDLGLSEVLDFLAHDPQTHSIVVYMEGIRDARRFMSALRSAAHAKPVVVLKAGRQRDGNAAALTHSAALVGSDDVFDAALRRAGAVRVRSFVELFSAAKCLASRYRPTHQRLAIVTNGGGPGVLAADWVNEIGLALGTLSPACAASLAPQLPALATLSDLIDLSESAGPAHYAAALQAALAERQIDGVLAIFSPKEGVDATAVAQTVADALAHAGKPLLACWMGDASVVPARALLRAAEVPNFRTPEAAVGAFGNIAAFYRNQQLLQQTPPPLSEAEQPDIEGARLILQGVLAERRHVLTEMESKALLAAFHIPVTHTVLARSAHEAMMVATQLGFPVALKIDSPDITHKSDVGGVALNLWSASAVRDAYTDMVQRVARHQPGAVIQGVTVQNMAPARRGREVCIGVLTDAPFGPVITFGAGGSMIELISDRAMELPPLNQFLAGQLIDRSRVARTLGAWHGAAPVHRAALEQILLRVSEMVCALPQLREMDINPLIVDDSGAVAVDARMVVSTQAPHSHAPTHPPHGDLRAPGLQLGPASASRSQQAYAHLAILPYPAHHTQQRPLRGGGNCVVRPIRPDDAQMIQQLVRELAPESRYFRFASRILELAPSTLARLTLIDYDRDMALVAVLRERTLDAAGEPHTHERIVGVSRYAINPDYRTCEFALLVADGFAGQGLGASLMQDIMDVARERGLAEIQGLVLRDNTKMLGLMRRLGFASRAYPEEPEFKLVTHPL